jgi:hypothetical protein
MTAAGAAIATVTSLSEAFARALYPLVLGAPGWLLLLAVAPALFIVARWSLGDFTRGERIAQAVLRLLVLAGLALALARPALRRPAGDVSAVALVDVSDSVSDSDLTNARSLIRGLEQAAARRAPAHASPVRVVRFAATPEELVAPGHGRTAAEMVKRFEAPGGAATDLALAMGLGAGLFDPAGIPRLLVVSDGQTTGGDAVAAAERAAARGVRVYVHTLAGART